MADQFTFSYQSKIGRDFDALSENLRPRLKKAITDLCIKIMGAAKGNAAHGKRSTGALANSISFSVTSSAKNIRGKVAAGSPYGWTQEYGSSATVQVGDHLRLMKQVFGKPVHPFYALVPAHQRQANVDAKHYLRDALAAHEGEIDITLSDKSLLGI
jgi:hypothetical protein